MQCLSLKVDYAFKKLFVTEPTLLVDFLNSVFDGYTELKIQSLEILKPELPGASIEDKAAVLDIQAIDIKGRRFYVEMQAIVEIKKLAIISMQCKRYTHHDLNVRPVR